MPRRPGGKYKGLIHRTKGEETLAVEAEERAARARMFAVKRVAELKARQLTAGHGLKSSKEEEEEAKKMKILNMMVGGKRSVEKYFLNWIVGVRQVKKEKMLHLREAEWRKSCDCRHGHGDWRWCQAAGKLSSALLELPFDHFRKEAELQNLRSIPQQGQTPTGRPAIERSTTTSALALPPLNATSTMAKTMSMTQLMQKKQPKGPWLDYQEGLIETGFHQFSERIVKLERRTMRFEYSPRSQQEYLRRKEQERRLREERAALAAARLEDEPQEPPVVCVI